MTPQVRQWLYTVSAVASALIPLLVTYKVLDPASGSAWVNLIGVLGVLGTGGAATAAVVTAKQRHEGTLDFTGTPAQQAISAIQATVNNASNAVTDLTKVKNAVEEVLATGREIAGLSPGSVLDVLKPTDGTSDPASANYQP